MLQDIRVIKRVFMYDYLIKHEVVDLDDLRDDELANLVCRVGTNEIRILSTDEFGRKITYSYQLEK